MKFKFFEKFVKKQDTKNFPILLNKKKIYILPTKYGLLFIILLIAMLIGSSNYNNNLGFLLTFFLGSIAFISIIYTYRNLLNLTISSIDAKPVFAKEKIIFDFNIIAKNYKRFVVGFGLAKDGFSFYDLYNENTIRASINSKKRGIYKPERIFVKTLYPFGLFRSFSYCFCDVSCIVYPKPISSEFVVGDDFYSSKESKKKSKQKFTEGVDDFYGLRNYQPQDSLKLISWKTFSKNQVLLTKVFTESTGSSLIFDFDKLIDNDIEIKLSKLCYMVLKAHNQNLTYGLKIGENFIKPGKGSVQKNICLKALALYKNK